MIALADGTDPKGVAVEVIPSGNVNVGSYSISPADWARAVEHVSSHKNFGAEKKKKPVKKPE